MTEKICVIVASVHHSGTHFITDQIVNNFEARHLDHKGVYAGPPADKMQIRVHCEPHFMGFLKSLTNQYKAIVPLRHPMSVAASWKKRDKPEGTYTAAGWLEDLATQWNILKQKVDPNDPLYLPLDVPDRETWLDAIREYLCEPCKTSWPVVGSVSKSAELTESEKDRVRAIMSDGFFDRFGYEV